MVSANKPTCRDCLAFEIKFNLAAQGIRADYDEIKQALKENT